MKITKYSIFFGLIPTLFLCSCDFEQTPKEEKQKTYLMDEEAVADEFSVKCKSVGIGGPVYPGTRDLLTFTFNLEIKNTSTKEIKFSSANDFYYEMLLDDYVYKIDDFYGATKILAGETSIAKPYFLAPMSVFQSCSKFLFKMQKLEGNYLKSIDFEFIFDLTSRQQEWAAYNKNN